MFFDTHCHLCDRAYSGDLDAVISRARDAGVLRILIPGTTMEDSEAARDLACARDGLFAAAGIHPSEADRVRPGDLSRIGRLLLEPDVIAVGESGLDLHWENGPPLRIQTDLLLEHIRLADAFGLTLVLHSRDAEAELLDVLDGPKDFPVVLHSYTGPADAAFRAVEQGYYIGLSGPITYPANSELRHLASILPRDRVLAETDGPYLTPQARRGRRNEPALLEHTLQVLAGVWEEEPEASAEKVLANSLRAFQMSPVERTDLVYRMYGRLYMNITGRCDNNCTFCVREKADGLAGYRLAHDAEPDRSRLGLLVSLLEPEWGSELVFCGYGEPTMRPGLLRELASAAAGRGFSLRLNTNGLCLARMSRDEALRMLEPIGTVSVSLNAHSPESYQRVSRPSADGAWEHLLEFILLARGVCEVHATAVAGSGVDLDAVAGLAEQLQIPFRVRGL